MTRKTVSLKSILEYQMRIATLPSSDKVYGTSQYREGVNQMTAQILHEAGAYAGFMYLDDSYLPEGTMPGIVRGDAVNGEDNKYPDDTRRWYHTHRNL